jgi:UDP-N-acetylmuramyl pentapeptide phosphotransferase/UDP-N-acetylglucosamine-1-phosphate transferase
MMPTALTFAACVAALTLVGGLIYRVAWQRLVGPEVTPTGFGAFLAVALLSSAMAFQVPGVVAVSFVVLLVATAIYWFDDFRGLSAKFRMAISFVAGMVLCALLLSGQGRHAGMIVLFAIGAGAVNLVLTNIVNFYDGADLNLATFVALTACAILLFVPGDHFLAASAIACLGFIVPFAILNSRPKTIYLGDAGSFAFACFLTMIAINYFSADQADPRVAIPLALPALDTFYVLMVRIIEKHDLMTRNYLHLYQRLNRQYSGFGYLMPQIVNAGLVLALATALEAAGWNRLLAVTTAMIAVTVPFYFACRRLLLSSPKAEAPPA